MRMTACLALLIFFLSSSSFGLYGARPMGMGGAFTSIADDGYAAYWNPAGLAINPGIDITGSFLATNRNELVGDNIGALKMNFEAELNPFAWIAGVSAVSLLALEGAKYLSDQGILKKNWGRKEKTSKKEEAVAEKVLESGAEKTEAVGQKVKEKAIEAAGAAGVAAKETAKKIVKRAVRDIYWGPYHYPYYHYHYGRPTYWDRRETEEGKAQFAGGFALLTDKNSVKNQNSTFYTLTLATGYEQRAAIGGNVNFYDITIPSPGNIRGYGAGIDLGILARPADEIAFGLTAKEALTTDVRFENGSMIRYAMTVNGGISLTPIPEITAAFDIRNIFRQSGDAQTYHYGIEGRPFPGLAVRAGLYDQSKTVGASVMVDSLIIDYAYLGGSFNRTHLVGFTWKL